MSRVAFVRMYPSDWRSGCMGLSLDQEGLYVRLCMFILETGHRVPLDDSQAAKLIGVQILQYRRVIGDLLRLGKVHRHHDGYGNPRAEAEFAKAQAGHSKSAASPERGSDRKADQGPGRAHHEDTPPVTPPVTGGVDGEKTQCFLRATKESYKESKSTPLPPKGAAKVEPFDCLKAFEAYNAVALRCGLPQASKLTPRRARSIAARIREYGPDSWTQALANIEKSSFLTGATDAAFRADLDFMCQAKSFGRLHDGGYGNGRHSRLAASQIIVPKVRESETERDARLQAYAEREHAEQEAMTAARGGA